MKIYFLITSLLIHAAKGLCPEGWQSDVNEWMANKDKFNPPPCYQFTVITNTISTSSTTSHVVTVKNKVALGDGMSLSDYMEEISTLCYMRCPVSGASCRIAYYPAGYPFQILIDEDQSIVGEERNIEILNFEKLDCDDIEDVPAPVEIPVDPPVQAPFSDAPVETPVSDAPVEAPVSDAPVQAPVEELIESSAPVNQPIAEPVEEPVVAPVASRTPVAQPSAPEEEDNQGGNVSDLNTDEIEMESSALAL